MYILQASSWSVCNQVIEKCKLPVGSTLFTRDRKKACILYGGLEFCDLCFVGFRSPCRVPVTPEHPVMHWIVAVMYILYVRSDLLLISALAFACLLGARLISYAPVQLVPLSPRTSGVFQIKPFGTYGSKLLRVLRPTVSFSMMKISHFFARSSPPRPR